MLSQASVVGMAGVVDDRPEDPAVVVGRHAPDDERVVGSRGGIEATDDPAVLARRVGEIAVPGQIAPPGGPRQRRGRDARECLLARLEDGPAQLVEVRADQLAAGHVAPAHRRPRSRVRVGAVDEQLSGLETECLTHGGEHALLVGGATEIAEQRDVEADEEPRPISTGRPERQSRRAEAAGGRRPRRRASQHPTCGSRCRAAAWYRVGRTRSGRRTPTGRLRGERVSR